MFEILGFYFHLSKCPWLGIKGVFEVNPTNPNYNPPSALPFQGVRIDTFPRFLEDLRMTKDGYPRIVRQDKKKFFLAIRIFEWSVQGLLIRARLKP